MRTVVVILALALGSARGLLVRGVLAPGPLSSFSAHSKIRAVESSAFQLAAVGRGGGRGSRKVSRRLPRFQGVELSVTNALLALNLLVFGATRLWPSLQSRFLKNNALISYGQTYRIFTSTLLHGSVQHLVMNLFSLTQIGPIVEQSFGAARMASIYIGSGALANVGTYLLSQSPRSVGASGCLFGLIGALGLFFYRNKKILGPRADAGFESIKRTVFINLAYGFMSPGIDNGAHVGGLVGGALLSALFGPRLLVLPGGAGSGGRLRVVDRPVLNYIPAWRRFLSFGSDVSGGGVGGGGGGDEARFRPKGAPLLD